VLRLRMPGGTDSGDFYEKVEPASPTTAELQALAGTYVSDEAEATFRVSVEGSSLVLLRRPDTKMYLRPTFRDAFSLQGSSVRFLRDSAGRVAELSLGEGRVWDLRFRKVQ
jgi:hypothetical protein